VLLPIAGYVFLFAAASLLHYKLFNKRYSGNPQNCQPKYLAEKANQQGFFLWAMTMIVLHKTDNFLSSKVPLSTC
jgi:hypothetical protein